MRGWLLALLCGVALFLGGLVLSYVLWVRIETASPPPCSSGAEQRVAASAERLSSAAALLWSGAEEVRITPRHIFHFPFDHVCVTPPGLDARELVARLGTPWACAARWTREVGDDDTFLSVLAVSGNEVTPVRLRRADFDLGAELPERLNPETVLILRKRPGSEQVLLRTP